MRRKQPLPDIGRNIGVGCKHNYSVEAKAKARQDKIIDLWRMITGKTSIDRQYWCLCAQQDTSEYSEIVQLVSSGLLSENQFVGIDIDQAKITVNRKLFPQAKWYCGSWLTVIKEQKVLGNFNPSIVYLDSINLLDTRKIQVETAITMKLCQPQTLLLVNVISQNLYECKPEKDHEIFIDEVKNLIGDNHRKLWEDKLLNELPTRYRYISKKSPMLTYAFWRN
jgi:hypothetical protein